MNDDRKILTPFNPREAISTTQAAERAGKSPGTIRGWADRHGLGRKIGGELHISRVALEMFLESDDVALLLYLSGERETETVRHYFDRLGL